MASNLHLMPPVPNSGPCGALPQSINAIILLHIICRNSIEEW